MIRGLPLIFVYSLVLACAQQDPLSDKELWLHVEAESYEVEFGKAFSLEVRRGWSKMLSPESWNDNALAPLTVKLLSSTRREEDRHVEEVRRYHAYAFDVGELVVPAPTLKARDRSGSQEQEVSADPLTFAVYSALPENAPVSPELPGPLMKRPYPTEFVVCVALLLLTGLAFFVGYIQRRSRSRDRGPATRPVPPGTRARARLEALRPARIENQEAILVFYDEISLVVREFISEYLDIPAPEMTTQELAVALNPPHFDMLSNFLTHCDRVKFGGRRSDEEDRLRLLETATRFVELAETAQTEKHESESVMASSGGEAR